MRTVVFTVVHPGSAEFAEGWYKSVLAQQDQGFDLCVYLDGVSAPGFMDRARLMQVEPGTTIAQVRWQATADMRRDYEAIVFSDSDDEMRTDMVLEAKRRLAIHDAYICSLECMDARGRDVGVTLSMPGEDLEKTITEQNFLGLGNSAFRTQAFSQLDSLAETYPLDWLLAVWALDRGLSVYQDKAPRVRYRLGGPGFPLLLDKRAILHGAQIIARCWSSIADYMLAFGKRPNLVDRVADAASRYAGFLKIIATPANLELYTGVVSRYRDQPHGWWWYVAYKPALEDLGWSPQ